MQVAFRLGLLANDLKDRISQPSAENKVWSAVFTNADETAVQAVLDSIPEFKNLPESLRPCIAATSGSATTVSAPPAILDQLIAICPQHKIKRIPIFLPAHNPKLFSSQDVNIVLETTKSEWHSFRGHLTLISGGSGTNVWAPNFADALRSAVVDCLIEPVRWEKVTAHIAQTVRADATSSVVIAPILTGMDRALGHALANTAPVTIEEVGSATQPPLMDIPASKGKAKLAIVGLSGRFPEAANLDDFWDLLYQGLDVVKEVPKKRWNWETHVTSDGKGHNLAGCKWGCWLDYADQFDPRFFNISPKEAPQMDPAQRMALMTTHEALESAGFVSGQTYSSQRDRVGVFHGVTSNDYLECNSGQYIDTYFITGGNRGFIPGRINFCFEFCGPSYTNDTACSSSLAAIHLACNSLWRGDCDTAVAGGTNMCINPDGHTGLDKGFFLSRTGNCKPFDDAADGYCRGEGVATIIIKRLDDALLDNDPILGVILGATTNHSAMSDSMTRPHLGAQVDNMQAVLNEASIDPRDVSYVELHGTGTQVGDAVEMQSVLGVFSPDESFRPADKPLYVGSVKGNVGHGEGVSGITSLAKVLLMMKNDTIPPHCGIKPGSKINRTYPDLPARNVHIAMEPTAWVAKGRNQPRRCLINNFSAAGGNTALLLEDAPVAKPITEKDPRGSQIVAVSGHTASALKTNLQRLIQLLSKPISQNVDVSQLSWTTTARRNHRLHRVAVVGSDVNGILKALKDALDNGDGMTRAKFKPKLLYAFTGQGSQYTAMGKQLFDLVPSFRSQIQAFDRLATSFGFPSFESVISSADGDIRQLDPAVSQLALTALEMALSDYLRSLGLQPTAVVGHSLGEYAALYTAGVLTAADTLFLVGKRATLLKEHCKRGTHAMLAVGMPLQKLQQILHQDPNAAQLRYEIACINGPKDIVVSGRLEDIQSIQKILANSSVKTTILATPFAFHSAQVEPILEEFTQSVSAVVFNEPTIPVICPLTSQVCSTDGTFGARYLARHCREAVNMHAALETAKRDGIIDDNTISIEVGPQPIVSGMIKNTLGSTMTTLPVLQKNRDTWSNMSTLLSLIYRRGLNVNWNVYGQPFDGAHRVVSLPDYGWDLKSYWIDYENDWCIYKPFGKNMENAKPRAIEDKPAPKKALIAPVKASAPTLLATKPRTTTIHKMIKEDLTNSGATLIYETDLSQEDTCRVAGGHIVSNVPFTTPSVFADMALVLGNYLKESLLTPQQRQQVLLDVGEMVADKVLIPHGKGAQPVRVEMKVSWKAGSPYIPASAKCFFYSVTNSGSKASEHGWCTLLFTSLPKPQELTTLQQDAQKKLQRLRGSANDGTCVMYNKASGYRLMATVAHFAPDYKLLDEMILDDVGLEASCFINTGTVAPGGSYATHPGLIDAVTQIGGFCVNAQEALDLNTEVFITHGWKSFQIYNELAPKAVYRLVAHMSAEPSGEFYTGDTVMIDENNKIMALMRGVSFRRVSKSTHKAVMSTIVRRRQKADGELKPVAEKPVPRAAAVPIRKPAPPPQVKFEKPPARAPIIQAPVAPIPKAIIAAPVAAPVAAPMNSAPAPKKAAALKREVDDALNILAEESGISRQELTDDTHLADIGVDSLLSMVIAGRFREDLGLPIDPDFKLFVDCPTIEALKKFVSNLCGGGDEVEAVAPEESFIIAPVVPQPVIAAPPPPVVAPPPTPVAPAPQQAAKSASGPKNAVALKHEVNEALDILAEESGISRQELTDDTHLADIGVDSLLSMVIAGRFREDLGLPIDPDFKLFVDCPTIEALKKFVSNLCGGDDEVEEESPEASSANSYVEVEAPQATYTPSQSTVEVVPAVFHNDYAEQKVAETQAINFSTATSSTENYPITPAPEESSQTESASIKEESFLGVPEARNSNEGLASAGLAIVSEESGLALSDLTDDTNFADIGVDSLLSMVITSRFREDLQLDLDADFSLFLSCPTVGKLTTFLRSMNQSDSGASDDASSNDNGTNATTPTSEKGPIFADEPCLPASSVILQGTPKTAQHTVFLLPDGSGSAFSYVDIPKARSDIAIVGINCPYIREPEKMQCSPEALIQSYVNAISQRQPHGPYHLGGWSCGGALAYACADVLIQRGEQVSSLLIIDAPVPNEIGHLPVDFYEFVGKLGLYGDEEPPAHLIPHFMRSTQTLCRYRPVPLKTNSPPKVGILWATESVMDERGGPEALKRKDHFLTQARKNFGPDGWEKLIPGAQFRLDKVLGANHFNMMNRKNSHKILEMMESIL